jgi:hypothetical protein
MGLGFIAADPSSEADGAGAALFVMAGCVVAMSVPMWIRGATRVTPGATAPRPRPADVRAELRLGPTGAALGWRL